MVFPERFPTTRARWPASFLSASRSPSNRYVDSAFTNAKLAPPCTQIRTQTSAGCARVAECRAPHREQVIIPSYSRSVVEGLSCCAPSPSAAAPAAAPSVASSSAITQAIAAPSAKISIQTRCVFPKLNLRSQLMGLRWMLRTLQKLAVGQSATDWPSASAKGSAS